MQKFKIEIEIDENGNLKAETKGMEGEICITELEKILKGIEGKQNYKNKPEFYKKAKTVNKIFIRNRK
ncbi:DUF2997 domain-containing protein [Nautilia sp.]